MKKTLATQLLTMALLSAMVLFAAESAPAARIDAARAAEIAARMMPMTGLKSTAVSPRPTLDREIKGADSLTAVYCFREPKSSAYVIVAGDDSFGNPVLGYGTGAEDGMSSMPPAMKWWLDCYAQLIGTPHGLSEENNVSGICSLNLSDNTDSMGSDNPGYTDSDVAPLLGSIAWGQSYPYNSLCPEKDSERCVTGCVATSTAQVMKFWEHPAKGNGSWSYKWNGTTLTSDFSSHTYDWNLITPTYGSGSTGEEIDAVARLMLDAGISFSMTYGTSSSGAYSISTIYALINNFGYDKGIRYSQRTFYGADLWNKLIKDELDAGRPVIYIGQSSDEGHQFICDGYAPGGYYHFNWGWSGRYDGYFLLTALNPRPDGQDFTDGYNYNQAVITRIEPDKGSPSSAGAGIFANRFQADDARNYSLSASACTFSPGEVRFDLGYAVCDSADVHTPLSRVHKFHSSSINPVIPSRSSGVTNSTSIYNNTATFDPVAEFNLADGRYYITPVSRTTGSDRWEIMPCGLTQWIALDVTDGSGEIATAETRSVVITRLELASEAYPGQEITLSCSLRAENGEIYDPVCFEIRAAAGTVVSTSQRSLINIADGEAIDLSLTAVIPADIQPGEYTACLLIANREVGQSLPLHIDRKRSSVEGIGADAVPQVSAVAGGISLSGEFARASVYDLSGRRIFSATCPGTIPASPGIYIITFDNASPIKIAVN